MCCVVGVLCCVGVQMVSFDGYHHTLCHRYNRLSTENFTLRERLGGGNYGQVFEGLKTVCVMIT